MICWKQNFQNWVVSRGRTKCCQPTETKIEQERPEEKTLVLREASEEAKVEKAPGLWIKRTTDIRSKLKWKTKHRSEEKALVLLNILKHCSVLSICCLYSITPPRIQLHHLSKKWWLEDFVLHVSFKSVLAKESFCAGLLNTWNKAMKPLLRA